MIPFWRDVVGVDASSDFSLADWQGFCQNLGNLAFENAFLTEISVVQTTVEIDINLLNCLGSFKRELCKIQ